MANISSFITAFRNAVYGEDVRSTMIALANAINNESSQTASDFDTLKNDLYAINITNEFTFVGDTRINYVTGERQNSSASSSSGYVNVQGCSSIILIMRYNPSGAASGVAFYSNTNEPSFIQNSGVREPYDADLLGITYTIIRIPIPSGAKYVRTTWFNTSSTEYSSIQFGCIAEKIPAYVDSYTYDLHTKQSNKKNTQYDKLFGNLIGTDISDRFTNTWTDGKRINRVTGAVQNSSGCSASDYIDISDYKSIVLTRCYRQTNGASGIGFYDNEQTFISGDMDPYDTTLSDNTYMLKRIDIPEGAKYVRVTWWSTSTTYSNETPFICFAENKNWRTVDVDEFRSKSNQINNFLEKTIGTDISDRFTNTWTDGKRINRVTGAVQNSSGCSASDYIDISDYKSIVLTRCYRQTNGASGIGFYDNEQTFISGDIDPYDTSLSDSTYIFKRTYIPEDAKYVRVTWWSTSTTYSNEVEFTCIGEGENNRTVTVNEFQNEVKRLEDEIGTSKISLPEYYFDDNYIDSRVEAIRSIISSQSNKKSQDRAAVDALHNGDCFFWFTDPHFFFWSSGKAMNGLNSPSLIKYIQEKLNIRKVFCGGDLVGSTGMTKATCRKNFQKVKDVLAKIWDDTYMIIGNHEWNNPNNSEDYMDNLLTISELYNLFIKDKECDYGGVDSFGDYWLDNTPQKIRYICLNLSYKAGFENEQITWLGETLLDIPNGYTVIVLSHAGMNSNNGFSTTAQYVMNMLDAARAKTTHTFEGVTYNFANFGGEIACLICGHNHRDLSRQTTGGIWVISTTCDQGPDSGTDETFNAARVYGTITEQAIDVYMIDTTAKTINTIRIGGSWTGSGELVNPDRSFSYAS